MHALDRVFSTTRFPLSRWLVLVLAGAFAGLMVDLRVEHVDVVRDQPIGWLPIVYCGLMTVACITGCLLWNRAARLALLLLFSMAFIVGAMGFYFHNHGRLTPVVRRSVAAWTDPTMTHPDAPPQTAPLAFAGLGLLGVLASLRRFAEEQPGQVTQPFQLNHDLVQPLEIAR